MDWSYDMLGPVEQRVLERLVINGLVEIRADSPRAITITTAGMVALTETM